MSNSPKHRAGKSDDITEAFVEWSADSDAEELDEWLNSQQRLSNSQRLKTRRAIEIARETKALKDWLEDYPTD